MPVTIQSLTRTPYNDGEWTDVFTVRSVREAHDMLPDAAYQTVDRLSRRAMYDFRLVCANGAIKEISIAKQNFAESWACAEQWRNSIGARLSRGEAVAV